VVVEPKPLGVLGGKDVAPGGLNGLDAVGGTPFWETYGDGGVNKVSWFRVGEATVPVDWNGFVVTPCIGLLGVLSCPHIL